MSLANTIMRLLLMQLHELLIASLMISLGAMDTRPETQQVRETSVGWMLKRLSARLDDHMNARLAEHGLDLSRFAVLMTVLEHHPVSQIGVAEAMDIAAYRVSRTIDQLSDLGLVERRPDPASRRAVLLVPTRAAQELAPKLYGVVRAMNEQLVTPLTPEEYAQLVDYLQRMVVAQSEWSSAGGGGDPCQP